MINGDETYTLKNAGGAVVGGVAGAVAGGAVGRNLR